MKKPRFKQALALFSAVTMLGLLLSGCQSGSAAPSTSSGTAAKKPVKIVFVQDLGSTTRDALVKKIVQEAGVKDVNLVFDDFSQADFTTKLTAMFAAGEQVDMYEGQPADLAFIKNNYVAKLNSYVTNWGSNGVKYWDEVSPSLKTIIKSYDGNIYALPIGVYERTLYYRKDWLAEAGYSSPPTSWAQLIEMSKKIQQLKKGKYGYAFRGGTLGEQYYEMTVVGGLPANLINPSTIYITKENKSIFEYSQALQSTELYKQLYTEVSPPSSISWGYPEMVQGFYSGECCFLVQDAEVIQTCEKYMKDGTWGTALLPANIDGNAYFPAGMDCVNMSESSKNKDQTWEVMSALCSPTGDTEFSKVNGSYPVYTTMQDDPTFGAGYYAAYAQAAKSSKMIGYIQDNGYTAKMTTDEQNALTTAGWDNRNAEIQKMLKGSITPQQLVDEFKKMYAWCDTSSWVQARTFSDSGSST